MYALIALLLFVSMVLVAYAWFAVGVGIAIVSPVLIGVLIWLIFWDPYLGLSGDRRFVIVLLGIVLLVIESALFVGGLLRVLLPGV